MDTDAANENVFITTGIILSGKWSGYHGDNDFLA